MRAHGRGRPHPERPGVSVTRSLNCREARSMLAASLVPAVFPGPQRGWRTPHSRACKWRDDQQHTSPSPTVPRCHLLPPTVTYCPPGRGSAVSYASTEPRPGSGTPGGAGCGDPASTCGAGRQGRWLEGSGWPSRRLPWCPGVRGCEASRAGSPLGPCPTPQGLYRRATVRVRFVPPGLTSPRGPGGKPRPVCGPCSVGTLWGHHKDTCHSLPLQHEVYVLC